MKKKYKDKMMRPGKNKMIPKYVGRVELYFIVGEGEKQKRFLKKPGELFPEFPIDQARARDDFILVKGNKKWA